MTDHVPCSFPITCTVRVLVWWVWFLGTRNVGAALTARRCAGVQQTAAWEEVANTVLKSDPVAQASFRRVADAQRRVSEILVPPSLLITNIQFSLFVFMYVCMHVQSVLAQKP